MIYSIGTDIIEIKRVLRACEKESFKARVFSERELKEALHKPERLASDFAAKEAVAKALRTGFRGFGPIDIECLRDADGAPYIELSGGAKELSARLGIVKIHISTSDTGNLAVAYAVTERS